MIEAEANQEGDESDNNNEEEDDDESVEDQIDALIQYTFREFTIDDKTNQKD